MLRCTAWDVCGVLDRRPPVDSEWVGGYPVVGSFDDLDAWYARGVRHAVLAIGSNWERAAMSATMVERGFAVVGLRHPTALIENTARVAPDAVLCIGAIVAAEATVGQNALLNSGCIVEHECEVGAHAHIGPGARLAGRVKVGMGTFVGLGSCVRERIMIGQGVVIGAGSVVVDDVPDLVTAVGNPARIKESIPSPWLNRA
jgi:sugar O-acyltransferase (sialic acid O-acetyltransferase NeuD family)